MGFLQNAKIRACRSAYEAKMKEAMKAQRKGDILSFSELSGEAATLNEKLCRLQENEA